jgi:acyl-homoserine lactone acylase PvdQ
MRRGRARAGTAAVIAALAAVAAPAQAQVEAPGANDYGGFRDVLAAGTGSNVNPLQLAAFEADGTVPAAFTNQSALYDAMTRLAPTLGADDLDRVFKPATFGVPAGQVDRTESPRAGVRIVRDKAYGVPHVYGTTRGDTMFGAGYASAEDRLLLMELLRQLGRGRISEFAGAGPGDEFLKLDLEQLSVADYSEAELHRIIDNGVAAAGAAGPGLRQDLDDYTAGVNAYIAETRTDPTKLPAEYAALGKLPRDWTPEDSAAVATLVAAMFGRGGGHETNAALALRAAQARFGTRAGRAVFEDFHRRDDPESPVTSAVRRPFDDPGKVDPKAIAIPDPGSLEPSGPAAAAATAYRARGGGPRLASNAILVDARHSRSGHPLAMMGPQVGYYSPEILEEIDLHGPGIDVSGVTLPGVAFIVIMGHGPDFVWSATTATTDDTDLFAEKLCNADGSKPTTSSESYVYKGVCRPLERRDHVLHLTANLSDPGGRTGDVTIHLERSVHGPVVARATVGGAPVAYAQARSSYFHDLDSALGLKQLRDDEIHSAREFVRALGTHTNLGYNYFYADDRDIGWVQGGWYPRRAKGTDPSLPAWGTGRWDWQGFDPVAWTSKRMPYASLPKDVDPPQGYIVNWNNRGAHGWASADDVFSYGPVHRSLLLSRPVAGAIAHGRRLDLAGLARIVGQTGVTDIRGKIVYPLVRRALGRVGDPSAASLLASLDKWVRDGAFRRDLDGDGYEEDPAGIALMDAWWPRLAQGIFGPVLGPDALARFRAIMGFGNDPHRGANVWGSGWYGYVDKDLRAVFGMRERGRLSRRYCGRGSRTRCRAILLATLRAAAADARAALGPDPAKWRLPVHCKVKAVPQGCDQIQPFTAGAVSTPPLIWQNRPTFQQAAEIRGHRPR